MTVFIRRTPDSRPYTGWESYVYDLGGRKRAFGSPLHPDPSCFCRALAAAGVDVPAKLSHFDADTRVFSCLTCYGILTGRPSPLLGEVSA